MGPTVKQCKYNSESNHSRVCLKGAEKFSKPQWEVQDVFTAMPNCKTLSEREEKMEVIRNDIKEKAVGYFCTFFVFIL